MKWRILIMALVTLGLGAVWVSSQPEYEFWRRVGRTPPSGAESLHIVTQFATPDLTTHEVLAEFECRPECFAAFAESLGLARRGENEFPKVGFDWTPRHAAAPSWWQPSFDADDDVRGSMNPRGERLFLGAHGGRVYLYRFGDRDGWTASSP